VLILGATGAIGRATARAPVRRGHDIMCFVHKPHGSIRNPHGSIRNIMRIKDLALLSICWAERGSCANASLVASRRIVAALSVMTAGEI
jgi:nucleoside-diphosphate-sugar epimerase